MLQGSSELKKKVKKSIHKKQSANQWTKAIQIHVIRKSNVYCSSIGTNLQILEFSQNVPQNWNPDKTYFNKYVVYTQVQNPCYTFQRN